MSKFDEHGFISYSWAIENLSGFAELDPCCQMLEMLFPDVPHDCAATGLRDAVSPVPLHPTDPAIVTAGASTLHPGALVPLVGIFAPTGSKNSGSVQVTEPATGFMLFAALVLAVGMRWAGGQTIG
jgi:hypothetical protein